MNQALQNKHGTPATPTIYANKNVRMAVAQALNKQAYVDAFYAGLGKVAERLDAAGDPGLQGRRACRPTTCRRQGDARRADLTAGPAQIDLYYPSNVMRPYMPDPQNEAQAIAQDLTGDRLHGHRSRRWTGTLATTTTANAGQLPLYLLGWTCDWAGADNFLVTAFFGLHRTASRPTAFGYKNDQIERPVHPGPPGTDSRRGERARGARPRT